MKKIIIIIVSLLLFIASALFFAQNDSLTTISYFSGELSWQLNWIMLLCLFVGFVLGIASIAGSLLKVKFELRQTKNKLERNVKEINSLRVKLIPDVSIRTPENIVKKYGTAPNNFNTDEFWTNLILRLKNFPENKQNKNMIYGLYI